MFTFKELTKTNGFDTKNLSNAVQNSYAWSMTELGDYIYVGTSRNFLSSLPSSLGTATPVPPEFISGNDNNAEIWRYKKDGTRPWQKVFKADPKDKAIGFRAMITHKTCNSCSIYAASMGEQVNLFKSDDGCHWIKIDTSNISGTSSRALASFNGKLYMATLESGIGGNNPLLYSSPDPEIEPFKSIINPENKNFLSCMNPMGSIDALNVFNNKLYVGISTPTGAEVWRSKNSNPGTNKWVKIADKGFGDSMNSNIMSTGKFKNHLYVAVTKKIPLSLFVPLPFDLIRIDKNDKWQLVVGGNPLSPSVPSKGKRNESLSGFNSGFNNMFNVYGWQIKEFKDNLIITTYDSSTNIKTFLIQIMYNEDFYVEKLGRKDYNKLVNCYKKIYTLLCKYNYPIGFDMYSSKDGCCFRPVVLSGLNNPNNYGARTLYVSCENQLYLGTANPFEGLEVWQVDYNSCGQNYSNKEIYSYFKELNMLNKQLLEVYPTLLCIVQKLLEANMYSSLLYSS